MSVIRFVHVKHLRLGSPLTGLAHCPDWLRQTAREAVRRSVSNVIEAAVAARAHFVLISGSLTESSQDLPAAVTWLSERTRTLHENGIALVVSGSSSSLKALPDVLGAIRWNPDQQLHVSLRSDGRAQFDIHPVTASALMPERRGANRPLLRLQYSDRPVPDNHRLLTCLICSGPIVDEAAASTANRSDGRWAEPVLSLSAPERKSRDGLLTIATGPPQSLGPHEQGAFGCQLVEVDDTQQQISARFCPTDTVRYACEPITCSSNITVKDLTASMAERSRSLCSSTGQTLIVDWVIRGSRDPVLQQIPPLDEATLLQELRQQLDAGHSGIWPRRIFWGPDPASALQQFSRVA